MALVLWAPMALLLAIVAIVDLSRLRKDHGQGPQRYLRLIRPISLAIGTVLVVGDFMWVQSP